VEARRARVSGLGQTHRETALQLPYAKWFDLIIANREDLALILTSEQGKPLAEALGEVDIGGGLCRVLFRGSAPRLWRNYPDAEAGCRGCSR